jgi:hypothetical protein
VPEDEDRSPAAEPSWADVVVPDDLRDLTADVAAYHRELRLRRRQVRVQRLVGHRRAFPLIVVATALLVAVIVASLLTFLTGGTVDRSPSALPLAKTSVPNGQVGGLLPNVQVTAAPVGGVNGALTSAQMLRPAVLALIGPNCNCQTLLDALDGQAYQGSLVLDVVVSASTDKFADSLTTTGHRGTVNVYFDPAGTLGASVGASGVTAVAVSRDGLITDVLKSATTANASRLAGPLQDMLLTAEASG